jgi:hypothetical protein
MKTTPASRLITLGLVFLLLFGSVVPVHAQSSYAPLASGGSSIFPVIGLIGSWFRRNRTYRNAEEFISDQNDQYDAQLNTLDQQLANGTIYTPQGSDPQAQKAAYVQVKALIQQERGQMLDFAEGIKKGARHDFNQAAKQQVINIVMSAGLAQNILGAINTGFGQAQKLVDTAISELSGEGSGGIAGQISGLRNLATQLQLVGGLIGGETGENLNSTVQDILAKINSGINMAKDDLNDVKSSLSNVQTRVQALMAQGYLPTSSEVSQSLVMQLVGLGPGTATTEAILDLLGIRTGTSTQSIRDRAQLLLEAGENVRCRKIITDWLADLHALEMGMAANGEEDSSSGDCTEISPADLIAATSQNPSPTLRGNQPARSTGVPAVVCDASSLVSVKGTVQWTLPGVDRKCDEPLVFTLASGSTEQVQVYVHEVATGTDVQDRWFELILSPKHPTGSGAMDNWWSSDQNTEHPAFIAVYSDNACQSAGQDPAHAGVTIVPIPSHCP